MSDEIVDFYTEDAVRDMLREHAPEGVRGPVTALANKIGLTPKYLGDIMAGHKAVTPRVAQYFGLEPITAYAQRDPSKPMPKPPLPYGAVVTKLRELEIGDTFYIDRGKRNALHAQAGRIGITIRTGRLPNGGYKVERTA